MIRANLELGALGSVQLIVFLVLRSLMRSQVILKRPRMKLLLMYRIRARISLRILA